MHYQRHLNPTSTSLKINDHVIECDKTIWQISNIAATWVNSKVVPFTEPEPILRTPEPKFRIDLKSLAIACGAIWLVIALFFSATNFATFAALCVAAAMIYNAINNLNDAKLNWQNEKVVIQEQWARWDYAKNNPLTIYGLTLQTNAGSKPLFYSTNEAQINDAQRAIRLSMEKKSANETNITIDTLNIGGDDAINNFGSSIYQQSILENTNGEL